MEKEGSFGGTKTSFVPPKLGIESKTQKKIQEA